MARDLYQQSLAEVDDATGFLRPLKGVLVYLYTPGTQNLAALYQAPTGTTQGPVPTSGATGTNPIQTGDNGLVEFYADSGEYDIRMVDSQVSPRLPDRTLRWNSSPMADGAIPTAKLSPDSNLSLSRLGSDVLRQLHPIGEVIEWFRPAITVPIPSGFEICDGRIIAATSHDFGTGLSLTLPDLRGVMILGADTPSTPVNYRLTSSGRSSDLSALSVADGGAAVTGDPGIPGIRGAGGSHTRDFTHTHNVPAHWHGLGNLSIIDANHTHAFDRPGLLQLGSPGGGSTGYAQYAGVTAFTSPASTGVTLGGTHVGNLIGAQGFPSTNGDLAFPTGQGMGAFDIKPRYYGLLKLMKVRRA